MSENRKSNQQAPRSNPALEALGALVGEWETQVIVDGKTIGSNRTTFEWLEGLPFAPLAYNYKM